MWLIRLQHGKVGNAAVLRAILLTVGRIFVCPRWIRPLVILLKSFYDLSLRILVIIFLHVLILQRWHLLRSIFSRFLLLFGLLDLLNIQSINALETSEIAKFLTSTTRFLHLHIFWSGENGFLEV